MQRDFKGIWIPKEIWLYDGLNITEKVFLSEIDSLDQGGGCFAQNAHFSNLFKLSKNRCSEIISRLAEKGFLRVFFNEDGVRRLVLLDPFGISNPPSESRQTPSESRQPNNRNIDIHIDILLLGDQSFSVDECIEKLKSKKILLEAVCINSNLKMKTVVAKIPEFVVWAVGTEKKYNNHNDFYSHFSYWMRQKNFSDVDVEDEFNWFIKMFNTVSRRNFKGTGKVKNLFIDQLKNGYTGKEMETAVRNLYDSKNVWHAKTGYENATPEFLLTGDRMNKFLNVKYSS